MKGSLAKWALSSASTVGLGLAVAASLTFSASDASANPMDLAPERLTTQACDPNLTVPCGQLPTAALPKGNMFRPDNAAWAKLVSTYAMAIAPMAMHPARTTGYGGFDFSLWGSVTTIDSGKDYIHRGTEGAISGGQFPSQNSSPDSVLQLYGVSGRKGLPYGFELQGSVAYMVNTELVALGGGIRWALLEGFRTGALGYLPDLSVGGYVNTLTGSSKVRITVPSLDVQISKPFTLANQVVFQPYVGWQLLWILADSAVVDATPGVDPLASCNARPPTGPTSPTNPGEQAGDSGQMHCQVRNPDGSYRNADPNAPPGSPDRNAIDAQLDVNNNMVFQNVRFRRQRLVVGTAFRYELIHIVLHAAFDIASPESGAPAGDNRINGLSSQVTFGAMVGTSW
jgi:hypothetical protein